MRGISILIILILGLTITSCIHKNEEENVIKISPDFPRISYSLTVTSPGWYYLDLDLQSDTRWNSTTCPSSVVDVYSEDRWLGSTVVWDRSFTYSLFLGKITGEEIPISVVFSDEKSPCKDEIIIKKVSLRQITSVPEECLEYYPYLLGYTENDLEFDGETFPYNSLSDFPMFWVCHKNGDILTYILYYTNEDGGTGLIPAYLMYEWGRTADIENAFTVNLATGEMFKRDNETEDTKFEGSFYNNHPLLQVSPKDHGLVTEGEITDKSWQLLFAPPIYSEEITTREDALDYHQWSYRLMEWEMEREGKITTDPDTLHDQADFLAPLDYYVYLDLYISDPTKIAMRIRLADGDLATNDSSSLAWDFTGWKRVVLKLPKPVDTAKIEKITLLNLGNQPATVKINKFFYLTEDFSSLKYIFKDYSRPFTAEIRAGEEIEFK